MEVDMPQGTGGSAKEVANNLVDNETQRTLPKPGPKPQQSTKKHEKWIAQAPAGMDVEFEPPSTALIANQVDWDIDFNEDDQIQSIDQDDEHEPRKGTAKSTSRAKSSRTVKASNTADQSEDDAEEDLTIKIKRKNKSNVDVEARKNSDEEEEGEETSVVLSKKAAKHKGGKRKVTEVIDSDDTTHQRTIPPKRKASKYPVPGSSDDGMNEETGGKEVMRNPLSKVAPPSVNTRSRTSTKKPTEPVLVTKSGKISKAKPVSVRQESDATYGTNLLFPQLRLRCGRSVPLHRVITQSRKRRGRGQKSMVAGR